MIAEMIVRRRWWKWGGPGLRELPGTEVAIVKSGSEWIVLKDGVIVAKAENQELAKRTGEILAGA